MSENENVSTNISKICQQGVIILSKVEKKTQEIEV